MICDRCDKPIPEGEAEHVPVFSGSGAGATVVLHRDGCRVSPTHPVPYPTGRGR
ncbi:hypothetical protein ACIQPT_34930 [Streptomyces sp. NPDC091289]|uniref:hypothetical protein n=1 Tax=Streptomyces sp. NPDC091289 TaxID=3365989 RepID=UPI0037F46222